MYAIFSNKTEDVKIRKTLTEALDERTSMLMWLGNNVEIEILQLTGKPIDPEIIQEHDEKVKYIRRERKSSIEKSFELKG